MKTALSLSGAVLRRNPIRLLLTAFCAFLCFLSLFTLHTVADSLRAAYQAFHAECGGADLILYTEEADPQTMERTLSSLDEVADFTLAWRKELSALDSSGEERTVRILALQDEHMLRPVNQISDEKGLSLSYGYAVDFGTENLSVLSFPDGRVFSLDSSCYFPLFTSVYLDRYSVSSNPRLLDCYASMDLLSQLSGEKHVNLAFLTLREGVDPEEAKTVLRDAFGKELNQLLAYEQEPAIRESSQLLSLVERVCSLFPPLLFCTGLLFICLFFTGIAGNMKKTVSVLLTDGMSHAALFASFFIVSFVSLFLGMLLAIPAGRLLAATLCRITARNMGIPLDKLSFSAVLFWFGLGICVGTAILTGFFSVLPLRNSTICQIRAKHHRRKESCIRDTAAAFLCTAVVSAVLLSTMMYRDSLQLLRKELFEDRRDYDAEIIYSDFVPLTELEKLRGLDPSMEVQPILVGSAELLYNGSVCESMGVALPEGDSCLRFYNHDHVLLNPVPNQIILAEKKAEELKITPGQVLELRQHYGKKELRIYCRVAELSAQSASFLQLVSLDTVTEYLDTGGVMNAVLIRLNDADPSDFLSQAMKLEQVHAVQLRSEEESRFDRRFDGVFRITFLVILNSVFLGLGVFLLMGYAVWRRSSQKNAILFLLGESSGRIALRELKGWILGTALGLLCGIGTGIPAEKAFLALLSTEDMLYPFILQPWTLLFAVLLALLFSAGSVIVFSVLTQKRVRECCSA